MKKVLSVALASAMVLGMGANAFAISYSTGSNDKADWPEDFKFDGELFVTDKDGKYVEGASTSLNDNEAVDFQPGDVIWMPLYADDQVVYKSTYDKGESDKDSVTSVEVDVNDIVTINAKAEDHIYSYKGKYYLTGGQATPDREWKNDGKSYLVPSEKTDLNGTAVQMYDVYNITINDADSKLTYDEAEREVKKGSEKYYIGASRYKTKKAFAQAIAENGGVNGAYVTVDLVSEEGTDDKAGKPVDTNEIRDDYNYTGKIDKNWSINLIESSSYDLGELVAKAELYRATVTDVASYSRFDADIVTNAVYVKVTLKDSWKFTDKETVKYHVYVADNKSGKETNKVWVEGTYANTNVEYVDFDWTNDASVAKLWKVRKGENGTAVFDFADKAFFTVKMYSEESMYLDLSTAYDKAIAGEMDVAADSFFKFDNENANFSREGELLIVTNDDSLVPYSIEDGELVKVDAEYVEKYAIAHTNAKVNGFLFTTKQLGNYVLAEEEIAEEVEPEEDKEPAEENKPAEEVKPETKPNPETGAEDFVGLAVSLAVVSVAAAGALALKK